MKTILAFSALAAVASANLAGISIDSGVFSIANVNPDTGASTASTTTIRTSAQGALAFDATTLSGNDVFWSLQTDDSGAAYIAKQDLSVGGRFEACWLSTAATAAKPVSIFNDVQSDSIIATAVKSNSIGVYRFGINPNNRVCTETLLSSIPAAQLAPHATTQLGSRIFVTYEASGSLFTSSQGPVISSYDISTTAATLVSTTSPTAGLYFTSISADSATSVIAQGFDASSTTVTYGNWKYDLAANTVGTIRVPSSTDAVVSTASTFVAQNNGHYTLKLVTSTAGVTTSNVAFFDYSSTGLTNAEVTRTTATSNKIFKLFDMANSQFTGISTDASLANTVRLEGNNLYAAAGATTVSRCRFTVGSSTTANAAVSAVGYADSDGVSCALPASLGSDTIVKTEFAADGVNYVAGPSFNYGATTLSTAQFAMSKYVLDDGSAQASNQVPVTVDVFDAAGNKALFTSSVTGTITAESSDSAIASVTGNTATTINGRFVFPSLNIDVYSTTAANDLANIKLNFAAGSASATSDAQIRFIRNSRGSTAGLTLASSKFSYTLINPSSSTSSNIALGDRTLTADSSIAFGLHAYDNDNDVLNTVEITSASVAVLVGQAVRSSTQTAGVGSCIIPTTVTLTNSPIALAYESTDATTGASTFLGLVDIGTKTGADFKIVRYTRTMGSTVTTTCTWADVAELPMMSAAYAKATFLTGGRLAIVEADSESTTGGSLLHVYNMGDANTPGSWSIRNKALSFSVIGITQSGENEVAINGRMSSTDGVWRVNVANDASAITAPTQLKETFASAAEQAYFLASGTSLNSDASQRLSGSVTSLAARNFDIVALTGDSTTSAASKSITAADFINLFNINDASVASVARSATDEISVTANNVVLSSALTCRFISEGVTTFTRAATSSLTGTFPANGGSYSCGAIPSAFLAGSRAVYVALANDQTNFGAPGCISVGTTNQCPTINGVSAAPSTAPSNTGSTTIPINRQIVFFFAGKAATDCAASVATINAFLTAAGVQFTTVTEADCVFNANYVSTAVTTSSVRMLQGTSGIVINSVLDSAADKNTAVAFAQTAAGQTALGGATLNDANPAVASDDDDGLTDGEIAGIVIGSFAGVVLIGALIAFALKGSSKKAPAAAASPAATYSTRDATFTDATTASGSYDSTGASGSYDSTSGSYDSDSGSYDSEDYSDYSGSSYV